MKRFLFVIVATVILATLVLVQSRPVRDSLVSAHPGAHAPSPPTYDYDTATPGTQPPTSPLLANPASHVLRTHVLGVTALAPLAEVQAILPPGFNAVPTPSGSGTAAVGLAFVYQERTEQIGIGTFGPSSGLVIAHNALNTNTEPDRVEQVVLAVEGSDAAHVGALNAALGPGSSRLAEVKVDIKEEGGQLRFQFHVVDEALDLNVKVSAEGPAAIANRFHQDPVPIPFRTLNNGIAPNPPFFFASQGDNNVVATAEANLELAVSGGRPGLPGGGSLTVVDVGPTVAFIRWVELFTKPE